MADENGGVIQDSSFMQAPAEIDVEAAAETLEGAAPTETPEPEPEADPFGPKFAALSRREKAVNQRIKEFEAREQAWQKEQEDAKTKYSGYDNLAQRFKTEPLKLMEEHGLSYQQLTEMVLNEGEPTKDMVTDHRVDDVMNQVKELQEKLDAKDAAQKESELNAVMDDFKTEIEDYIDENIVDYELIKANESNDLIYEVIEQHHEKTGNILNIKDAADEVEKYLEEQVKTFSSLDKVKKMLNLPVEPGTKEPEVPGQSSTTLSNTHTAQVPNQSGGLQSREDSISSAASLIKWDD